MVICLVKHNHFLGDKIIAWENFGDSLPAGLAKENAYKQIKKLKNAKSYLDQAKAIIVDTLD